MIHFQSRSIPQLFSPLGEKGLEGGDQEGFAAAFQLLGQSSLEGLAAFAGVQRGLTVDPLGRRLDDSEPGTADGGLIGAFAAPPSDVPEQTFGDDPLPESMETVEAPEAGGSMMLPPLLKGETEGKTPIVSAASTLAAPKRAATAAEIAAGPEVNAQSLARSARTLLAVPRATLAKTAGTRPAVTEVPTEAPVGRSAPIVTSPVADASAAVDQIDMGSAGQVRDSLATASVPLDRADGRQRIFTSPVTGKASSAQSTSIPEIPVTPLMSNRSVTLSAADEVLDQMIRSFKPRAAAPIAETVNPMQHERPAIPSRVPVVQSVDTVDPLTANAWRWESPRVDGVGSAHESSGAARLVAQIAQPIQAIAAGRITQQSVTVHLNPPELGRVDIGVMSNQGGRVGVTIRVERGETERVLQQHLPQLRAALEQQGIDIQNLSLNLGDQQSSGGENPMDREFSGSSEQRHAPEQQQAATTKSARGPFVASGGLGQRLSLVI